MWDEYYCATGTDEVIQLLANKAGRARIIAGATDLILEMERSLHKNIDTVIDISRIPGLDEISLSGDGMIHLGAMVTHNQCVSSELIRNRAYPLARACWEVGAPQIRNRGTVAGNLITASPANDTITALMVLDARLVLVSERGKRTIPLKDFYKGVRKTDLQPDELLIEIQFPALENNQKGTFQKLALRRAQAISIVNVAVLLKFNGNEIISTVIALGAVAPTIIRASEAELFLTGKSLGMDVIAQAADLTMKAARPIDDIRASATYRREMVRILTNRSLRSILNGSERDTFPTDPVLLWGEKTSTRQPAVPFHSGSMIETCVNGRKFAIRGAHRKTLLRLLREDVGLTGTKEGCAEGECGACTIFLDGKAVMACLVPAGRAHGAEIITIEGIYDSHKAATLHPVQEAFIQEGAVQCGYCTPGFIMSAVKLLEERPNPTINEIQQALTGNLCRCTGYYRIISAVEKAIITKVMV